MKFLTINPFARFFLMLGFWLAMPPSSYSKLAPPTAISATTMAQDGPRRPKRKKRAQPNSRHNKESQVPTPPSELETKQKNKKQNNPPLIPDYTDVTPPRLTSEDNRRGKIFILYPHITSVSFISAVGAGGTLGFYLGSDFMLTTAYEHVFNGLGNEFRDLLEFEDTYDHFRLEGRIFAGNRLYLTVAGMYRKAKTWWQDLEGFVTTYEYTKYKTSIGPELAFGNRWQWSYFTLGVDWLAFYLPLVTLDESARYDSTLTTEQIDRAEKKIASHEKESIVSALRLGIGVSF